jgi:3-hydroxyisobutyrate dehydrogenase-like beta-hydroxyacid dehydrogenase
MGGAIARSILRAGYQLWVYDLRPAAVEELAALGARPAASIAELPAARDAACVAALNAF